MAVGAPSRWWSSALLALLALAWAAPDWSDCPSACQCKWTGGKKSALCRNAGLSAVPNSLNAEMQLIDLSHNNIPYLTKDAFRAVGLINLHKIFARQSGVLEVHRDAFRDLIILIEVDLSDNSISALQPGTFSGNDRLRLLTLSRNPLSELVEAQFPPLPHLRTLDLSGCRISRIHPAALSKLSALETLLLQGNRLQQIDAAAISVAAATLKALTLDGNPWRCDCRLRGFRDWLESRSQLRGSVPPSCEAPESVAGRPWPDVPAEDFACAPEVRVAERMLQAEVGGNVTFWCHVSGDPEPTVRWLVNGRPAGATNASGPEATVHLDEEPDPGGGRWATLSLFNVTEADAGEYACVAVNSRGRAVGNASLLLPQQVVTATTLSKADGWLVWAGVAAGGGVALGGAMLAIVCSVCAACRPGRGRRHRHRARHKRRKGGAGGVKGSVSFTDQEKKLLDASITTTERPSCSEGLGGSQPDMELLEQQQMCSPMETVGPPPPPVHITIESHPGLPPPGDPGVCGGGAGGGGAYPGALTVFPPPPAEFSTSVLPAGAFGNIFISVSR